MKNRTKRTAAMAAAVIMTSFIFASCGASEESSHSNKTSNGYSYNNNAENDYKYHNDLNTDGLNEEDQINTIEPIEPNNEEYNEITENEFKNVSEYPLSTFSTDVDTASFSNVRRMIEDRSDIDPNAVRTEEFINYFKYDYPQPQGDDKISITTELTDCPWNSDAKLMLVGLQAKEAETRDISSNIVFLIDVSGSMADYDKLPLVQEAFSMLAGNLGEDDTVSIVTYAGSDEVALEGASGAESDEITSTLYNLTAGGSTAGADGINTAYEIAEKYFIEGGNNRVILATDGDLNVGLSTEEELTDLIEKKRDIGIFLSVLGFGTGNLKDNKLEAIADNGNGNYSYIDSVDEAERVLVTEFSGTMFTVAKDAKVQVEFNPSNVESYRLVGYENRLLADEDFEDDTKDAGDIGSGQQVTAMYELILKNDMPAQSSEKTLKYQSDVSYPTKESSETSSDSDLDGELLTVSVRYKEPDEDVSKLIDKAVTADSYTNRKNISDSFHLSTAAVMFAKTLRNSTASATFTMDQISDEMSGISLDTSDLSKVVDLYKTYYENR